MRYRALDRLACARVWRPIQGLPSSCYPAERSDVRKLQQLHAGFLSRELVECLMLLSRATKTPIRVPPTHGSRVRWPKDSHLLLERRVRQAVLVCLRCALVDLSGVGQFHLTALRDPRRALTRYSCRT